VRISRICDPAASAALRAKESGNSLISNVRQQDKGGKA
jgi:hypothetical protein